MRRRSSGHVRGARAPLRVVAPALWQLPRASRDARLAAQPSKTPVAHAAVTPITPGKACLRSPKHVILCAPRPNRSASEIRGGTWLRGRKWQCARGKSPCWRLHRRLPYHRVARAVSAHAHAGPLSTRPPKLRRPLSPGTASWRQQVLQTGGHHATLRHVRARAPHTLSSAIATGRWAHGVLSTEAPPAHQNRRHVTHEGGGAHDPPAPSAAGGGVAELAAGVMRPSSVSECVAEPLA